MYGDKTQEQRLRGRGCLVPGTTVFKLYSALSLPDDFDLTNVEAQYLRYMESAEWFELRIDFQFCAVNCVVVFGTPRLLGYLPIVEYKPLRFANFAFAAAFSAQKLSANALHFFDQYYQHMRQAIEKPAYIYLIYATTLILVIWERYGEGIAESALDFLETELCFISIIFDCLKSLEKDQIIHASQYLPWLPLLGACITNVFRFPIWPGLSDKEREQILNTVLKLRFPHPSHLIGFLDDTCDYGHRCLRVMLPITSFYSHFQKYVGLLQTGQELQGKIKEVGKSLRQVLSEALEILVTYLQLTDWTGEELQFLTYHYLTMRDIREILLDRSSARNTRRKRSAAKSLLRRDIEALHSKVFIFPYMSLFLAGLILTQTTAPEGTHSRNL